MESINIQQPGAGSHWRDCDPDVRGFVERVVASFTAQLGTQLVGVYLHGSLGHGCYRRAKSDIDLLIVVRDPLPPDTRRDLALLCVTLSDARPTVGDLELSVIQAAHARRFTHPLPYEVHYSSDCKEAILRREVDYAAAQCDRDLAAHCTVARARGVCLMGAPIEEVFGPVLWRDFLDAVLDDWRWIVDDDHIIESPFYAVLNSCRVLQLLAEGEGTVASKEEGAQWALAHVPPAQRAVVQQALDCYCSDRRVAISERKTGGIEWNSTALRCFRDYAATEVARLTARAQNNSV